MTLFCSQAHMSGKEVFVVQNINMRPFPSVSTHPAASPQSNGHAHSMPTDHGDEGHDDNENEFQSADFHMQTTEKDRNEEERETAMEKNQRLQEKMKALRGELGTAKDETKVQWAE